MPTATAGRMYFPSPSPLRELMDVVDVRDERDPVRRGAERARARERERVFRAMIVFSPYLEISCRVQRLSE